MGKGIKIVALIIVIVVAVIGLLGYSYTKLGGQITAASLSGITLAQPSTGTILKLTAAVALGDWLGVGLTIVNSINLNLQLSLTNNGLLPVILNILHKCLMS